MICSKCEIKMKEFKGKNPNNMEFNYYKCSKCGKEEVDMNQFNIMMKKNEILEKKKLKVPKKIKINFSKLR